jgi:hypothetical protein
VVADLVVGVVEVEVDLVVEQVVAVGLEIGNPRLAPSHSTVMQSGVTVELEPRGADSADAEDLAIGKEEEEVDLGLEPGLETVKVVEVDIKGKTETRISQVHLLGEVAEEAGAGINPNQTRSRIQIPRTRISFSIPYIDDHTLTKSN